MQSRRRIGNRDDIILYVGKEKMLAQEWNRKWMQSEEPEEGLPWYHGNVEEEMGIYPVVQ